MDKIYNELQEVKLEAEKLREECRAKTELSDSLRKAHVEQLAKVQQVKLEIDKLAQELNAKSEEICEIRQMYEELQSSLHRKDLFLQQISSANEKLRAEYSEKILNLEGENRDLVLALDDASARIQDLEKRTRASSEEIAGLKRLLSIKPEKSFEVQKNASKDLKVRDEYILQLEEESRITKDQLKWKNEQFSHLEEAHRKLQTQFHASKVEWQKEKITLIDEISSLQAALDAQLRLSESLETQLRTSNQALAHEESRRKVLEIEVSESKSQFENVFRDCQEAKSEIEQLTMKRDEEIAELRVIVRKKETLDNEMKYKTAQLEQENSELVMSLKDIQESQLNNNSTSSLKKLQNKFRGLEKLHNKCAINLKEKEAERNSQIEKMRGDMNYYLSELDCKNKSIRELHETLEDCQCLLEAKNEEIYMLAMVLKSQFDVAYSKLYDTKEKLEMGIMQIEEKNIFLNQQLQSKNTELHKVQAELKQRCDQIAVLMEQVESLDSLKPKDNLMEEELRRFKAMLDESYECQHHLKQLLELENTQKENIKNALEMVGVELANRTSEVEQCNLELQMSKPEMEILKLKLEENQVARDHEKSRLVDILKDKDDKIGNLEEQKPMLESAILTKSEAAEMLNQEKDKYIQVAEEKNCRINRLQNEVAQLINELAEIEAANSALLNANKALEQENERFSSNINEKDHKLQELQKEFESLDQDFKTATISFGEKEVMLNEALKAAQGQKILEIEEKNQSIANLGEELNSLHKEVEFQGKSLVESMQEKESEMQELKSQLGKERRRCNEDLLEELESYKRALFEDLRKASIERENMLAQFEGVYAQIGVFCSEDVELTVMLDKMMHLSKESSEPARNLLSISPPRKSIQVTLDERTPLTELNF